jgi:SNF2 family DNA or RNA helicase
MDLTVEDVYVIDPKNRKQFIKDCKNKNNSGYFICNWDSLRLMPELKKVDWFHIIGDEIHRAKNPKAQLTRALLALRTEYKTGLSGTPADDKPKDLWQILNWLWPNFYTGLWKFIEAYCNITTKDEWGNDLGYRKITGVNEDRIPELHKQMAPWYIRRRKEDVLPELPDKYYSRIYCDLHPKQRKAYDQMKKVMISWVEEHGDELDNPVIANAVVTQLIRLQQYADGYVIPRLDEDGNHMYRWKWKYDKSWTYHEKKAYKEKWAPTEEDPLRPASAEPYPAKQQFLFDVIDPSSKLDVVMELLEDRSETPIIIFSQFKSVIKLLEARLAKKGIPYGIITGDTKQDDRTSQVALFQHGKLRVFIGTIPAMREGITLTASSTVVFLDRVWSPSQNTQAEDRAHRIGQKDAVQIIDIVAKNTVDLGKFQKVAMKREYIQKLLGDVVDLTWFANYDVIEDYNIEYDEEVA